MSIKDKIIQLRAKRYTYKQIGDLLGVSKQRIHQRLKEYRTVKPRIGVKIRKDFCETCNSKSNLQIHHIDRNTENNNLKNLITLCVKCHRDVEVELRKSLGIKIDRVPVLKVKIVCAYCKKEFWVKSFLYKRKCCSLSCSYDSQRISLSDSEKKHRDKMLRKKYYLKNKEIILQRGLKWAKDNPEKFKKYQMNYYNNNKEKIKRYRKDYYKVKKLDILY